MTRSRPRARPRASLPAIRRVQHRAARDAGPIARCGSCADLDAARLELDASHAELCEGLVMRHEHQRGRVLAIQCELEVDDALTRGAVEIAGGLVRDQHFRCAREGPRERDALLLATRELLGIVLRARREPHARSIYSRAWGS